MEDYTIHHEPRENEHLSKPGIFGRIFKSTISSRYPGQPHDEITQRIVFKHIIAIFPFLFAVFILIILGIMGSYYLGIYETEVSKTVPINTINMA